MSAEVPQRRYLRFSLDIPAIRRSERGEKIPILIHQISLGGCLVGWSDDIFVGDEFRLEIPLPRGNFLPLKARALYKFPGKGIGAKFLDITDFEQKLLAMIITDRLEKDGLPEIDPFARPPLYIKEKSKIETTDPRVREEKEVEQILSSEQSG
ncbi:MAG: PilZ domain-containing protein [Pyrinomonadaceae bacterium]|nr:PilZ domain-containing protein [Pyrinomonadaceae bacterium]MCX7638874.1 PilZ domain-containing protein [Pyrinomonadaceae bacterium]MDW8304990.1 PilZ domain-containing protein [Acidobacteriota bacterium]